MTKRRSAGRSSGLGIAPFIIPAALILIGLGASYWIYTTFLKPSTPKTPTGTPTPQNNPGTNAYSYLANQVQTDYGMMVDAGSIITQQAGQGILTLANAFNPVIGAGLQGITWLAGMV